MSSYLRPQVVRKATISNFLWLPQQNSVGPHIGIEMLQPGIGILYFSTTEELIIWSYPTIMDYSGLVNCVSKRHNTVDMWRTVLRNITATYLL